MTRRAIQTYSPLAFNSDFSVTPQEDSSKVPVSAEELARLLSIARSEGEASARAEQHSALEEKMQSATMRLNRALADLVALAGHLEASTHDVALSETSRNLINLAAQSIIDGQGDLFAGNDPS